MNYSATTVIATKRHVSNMGSRYLDHDTEAMPTSPTWDIITLATVVSGRRTKKNALCRALDEGIGDIRN